MVTKNYKITGLDCAHCASKLQGHINEIEGVESAKINFVLQKLSVSLNEEKQHDIIENIMNTITNFEDGIVAKEI